MKLLLYCPNVKPYLLCEPYIDKNKPCRLLRKDMDKTIYNCVKEQAVNGKIVAECNFKVEVVDTVRSWCSTEDYEEVYETGTLCYDELLRKSGMNNQELDDYLYGEIGYAVHIKDIKIFENPKELSDYEYTRRVKGEPTLRAVLFEAPRGMKKIIAGGTDAILLPIRPEELYRILNGEQTIIIKKRVLKEMKK